MFKNIQRVSFTWAKQRHVNGFDNIIHVYLNLGGGWAEQPLKSLDEKFYMFTRENHGYSYLWQPLTNTVTISVLYG